MCERKWSAENGRRKMDGETADSKRPASWPTGNPRQEMADAKKKLERRHAGKQTITGYLRDNGEGA